MTVTDERTVDRDASLRDEAGNWLDANWDPELGVREWWSRVGTEGWTAPHFPTEWGGRGGSRR